MASAALDGGRRDTVDNVITVTTKTIAVIRTTSVQGKSQKEREAQSDDDGTVSFLRLPFLILGGVGGAVECRVLHCDTGVDEIINRNTVLYGGCFVVLLTFDKFDFMLWLRRLPWYNTNNTTTTKTIHSQNQMLICPRYRRKQREKKNEKTSETSQLVVAVRAKGENEKNSKSPLSSLQAFEEASNFLKDRIFIQMDFRFGCRVQIIIDSHIIQISDPSFRFVLIKPIK